MSYDEEQQRKSRVVVQTPTSRREVVQTEIDRYPDGRGGVSTGVVAAVAIAAIAITALVVYFLMNSNNTANDNANVRTSTTTTTMQPTPVQQQPVIIQQPAPAQQQPPVIVQQPAAAPPQTVIVPGPSTSTATTTSSVPAAPKSNVPDDMTIQTNVDKKLSNDQTFSALGITATVINGKVTLIGTVETPELKRQAESLVRNVRGVQKVDNQITVSGGTE